jgi:hypothetical protein
MFRAGEVTTNPSGDASSWKITHGSITNALKAKVPTERFTGTLSGYQFCHSGLPDNISGQLPHLGVIEVEGSTVRTERFYLATVGNYVRYETWQDLMDGVLSALDGAGTLQFAYKQGQDGDLIYYDATVSKTTVLVYGPAAVALGIGYLRDDKIDLYRTDVGSGFSRHFATAVQTVNAFFSPGNPIPVAAFGVAGIEYAGFDGGCIALRRDNGDGIWKHDVRYDSGTATVVLDQAKDRPVTKNDSLCKYVYQWDWADITFDFSGAFELYYNARGAWQVPEDGSSNRRLYLTGETDATQLDDGDPITFGDPDRFIPKEGVPVLENHGGTGSYMIMEGELDGTPADSSYIEIKGGAPGPTVDHAKGPESYPANVSAPNHRGLSLYWAPALQNEDPWQVADSRVMASDSPSLLFRELLGDTTTILDFPSRVPITTIPNVNATDDQVLIDWDAWAELDGFAPYNYDFTQKDITALGAMSSFAFTHGYRMTYGYKETERAFVLGLAPIAATSESQATFEGRAIDNQVLRPDVPTDKIGSGWLYSAVQMDVQAAPGAKREVRAAHSIGRTAHIAESKDLVVKDPISIFPDDETTGLPSIELLGRAESYARLFATPVNEHRLPLTLGGLVRIKVGDVSNVEWSALMDPQEGRRSSNSRTGLVTEASIGLDKIDATIRTGRKQPGIAPSMFVDQGDIVQSGTTLTITGLNTTPANSDFADPNKGLTDLAYFGCIDYNEASDEVTLRSGCSCTAYRVWIVERGTDTMTDAGASRNVWGAVLKGHSTDTLVVDDVTNGRCRIELDDSTNFASVHGAGADFVVIFGDRDDSGIQDCQLIYGFLGDADSLVQDSGANDYRAISWG